MIRVPKPNRAKAIISICKLFISAFFFYAWYDRFLRWDFNELGRYWDETVGTVTTSGWIWVVPALLFFVSGASGLYRSIKRRRDDETRTQEL